MEFGPPHPTVQDSPSVPERPARPAAALSVLARPGGVALLLALTALEGSGLLARVDVDLLGALASYTSPAPRGDSPTVLAIDDATLAVLGAPPWDAPTWERVQAALTRQGLDQAVLVDPWPTMIRSEATASFTLPVPVDTLDGRSVPAWPHGRPNTFAVRRLSPAQHLRPTLPVLAPWPGCEQGRCGRRGGVVLLREVDVPVVPLASLLGAGPGLVDAGGSPVLLGLTATGWAMPVATPQGGEEPGVVALARAIGSARVGPARLSLDTPTRVAWLLALYTTVAIATRRGSWRRGLLLGPFLALGTFTLLWMAGGIAMPVVGAVGAAAAPAVGTAIAVGGASAAAVRRLGLLVIRAASRAGTLRRRIATPDDLVAALADLTRTAAQDTAFAVLGTRPRGAQLDALGGFGLPATRFADGALTLQHPELAAASEALDGVPARKLLRDGTEAWVVPLHQDEELVGFWVLALAAEGPRPDPRRLGRLARWIGERLALPGVSGTFSATESLLPETSVDLSLENLFLAADEERRRWQTTVLAVGQPVLVTDVAGVVTLINPAMEDALKEAEIGRVRSLRELVVHLDGPERIEAWMRRLFGDGEPLMLPWRTPDRQLVARPVALEAARPGQDEALLGYVAWVEPVRAPPVRPARTKA